MTYEYKNLKTGRVHQVEQRITDAPFTHYDADKKEWLRIRHATEAEGLHAARPVPGGFRLNTGIQAVQRLVSGGTGFQLSGPRWAKDGYS